MFLVDLPSNACAPVPERPVEVLESTTFRLQTVGPRAPSWPISAYEIDYDDTLITLAFNIVTPRLETTSCCLIPDDGQYAVRLLHDSC